MNRRGFLQSILISGIAPAFIKYDSLMKLYIPKKEIVLPENIKPEIGKQYWATINNKDGLAFMNLYDSPDYLNMVSSQKFSFTYKNGMYVADATIV